MSRKRRFRRKGLARLELFFNQRSYTGLKSSVTPNTPTLIVKYMVSKKTCLVHYLNVTKKKLYNSDNTICKCC